MNEKICLFKNWTVYLLILFSVFSCTNHISVAPEGFEIEEGFQLSLVASEPLIKDPVDLEFDEIGNAYVLEMPGYPFEDQSSSIQLILDTDQDGVYDQKVSFAEELELASSILPYKQGMLVAAPPYLLFIKDTDGDQKADLRDTLMSGFSTGNLQHNYNGLTYGIDNWIYAANGGNSGNPHWWGDTSSIVDLRDNDLRMDFDRKIFEQVGASSGGYELGIDEIGRIFETHNLEHISQLVFPSRYLKNYKIIPGTTLSNVSDHEENGLSRIYPIGEQESRVNHPEQSGYFSGACGITYYGGGNLGEEYDQSIWVADVVLNLLHVDKLTEDGAAIKASRILENKDFLTSSDRSFRPVNMTVGPDGALYVVDMYREVIEHPEWIPDDIEKTLNLEAGKNKGRIYKIAKSGHSNPDFSLSDFENTNGLIESLNHPNQWVRNTAQRLLLEKPLSVDELSLLIISLQSKYQYARLHSGWILHSISQLGPESLLDLLEDPNSGIRENALVMAEQQLENNTILDKTINLLTDQNQRVRMQAALSLSTIKHSNFTTSKDKITDAILAAGMMPCDQWNIAAIALAAQHDPISIAQKMLGQSSNESHNKLLVSLSSIAAQNGSAIHEWLSAIADSNLPNSVKTKIVSSLVSHLDASYASKILPSLNALETNGDSPLIAATAQLRTEISLPPSRQFLKQSQSAIREVVNSDLDEEQRLNNLALIHLLPYSAKSQILYQLISNKESLKIQEAALRQLWDSDNAEIGDRLVEQWNNLGPYSRRLASDILLYKQNHHDALLTGLETGVINIGEMNFDLERRRTLLWWTDDEKTKRRAEALFSDSGVVNRKDVIDDMKKALDLTGSPSAGADVYDQLCSQCHQYGSRGLNVGPVLTEISRKSKASLLHDILDPNAAVDTKYINHKLETNNGTMHIGMVDQESDDDITIKKMGGISVTINKKDMKSFSSLGTSMMLEGLEANMTHQHMADLLAFLQSGD